MILTMEQQVAMQLCPPLVRLNLQLREQGIIPDEWYYPDQFMLHHMAPLYYRGDIKTVIHNPDWVCQLEE